MPSPSTSTISSFPDELLEHIFLHLPPREFHVTAPLVSRRWNRILRTARDPRGRCTLGIVLTFKFKPAGPTPRPMPVRLFERFQPVDWIPGPELQSQSQLRSRSRSYLDLAGMVSVAAWLPRVPNPWERDWNDDDDDNSGWDSDAGTGTGTGTGRGTGTRTGTRTATRTGTPIDTRNLPPRGFPTGNALAEHVYELASQTAKLPLDALHLQVVSASCGQDLAVCINDGYRRVIADCVRILRPCKLNLSGGYSFVGTPGAGVGGGSARARPPLVLPSVTCLTECNYTAFHTQQWHRAYPIRYCPAATAMHLVTPLPSTYEHPSVSRWHQLSPTAAAALAIDNDAATSRVRELRWDSPDWRDANAISCLAPGPLPIVGFCASLFPNVEVFGTPTLNALLDASGRVYTSIACANVRSFPSVTQLRVKATLSDMLSGGLPSLGRSLRAVFPGVEAVLVRLSMAAYSPESQDSELALTRVRSWRAFVVGLQVSRVTFAWESKAPECDASSHALRSFAAALRETLVMAGVVVAWLGPGGDGRPLKGECLSSVWAETHRFV